MVAVREGPEYGSNNEERKVRAPQGKVLGNTQSRQREGKCHRKYTALENWPYAVFRGKGEKVR